MASTPNFSATPRTAVGQVSVANANRDGTGTVVTIFTAGASGSRVDAVTVEAIVTTTAGMVRLFLHDGTNARLFDEIAVSAVTPSGTVAAFRQQNVYSLVQPIMLPNGWSVRAATNNAETFNVFVHGGDF